MEMMNALVFVAKAREYTNIDEIDPKTLGAMVTVAEEAEEPQRILNDSGIAEVEAWIKKHG